MRNNHQNNRFATAFSSGMLSCLDGSQSANAHENIETSIQKAKEKMCSIEAEIRDLKSENRRYRNRISDLEYELQQLELRSEE
jgi:septal ring factor EnvC (AmiA/AmiB activator)